jgi:regulator of sirC expression with transglutaminase-like and TPR domain
VDRAAFVRRFAQAASGPDADLAGAALMIAEIEYPELDADRYLARLDRIGDEAGDRLAAALPAHDTPLNVDADRYAKVVALNAYLFEELRFAGNEADYEDPRNSFLNEVLDRRIGIPITLSVLYIEVARRAGLAVEGINFPGHFLVRCRTGIGRPSADDLIIDPFHRGALLTRDQVARRSSEAGADLDDNGGTYGSRLLPHATKPQILTRMLMNLKRIYVRMHSFQQARDVTDLLLAIDPSGIGSLRDRGLLAYQLNDLSAALRDLQDYLKLAPSGPGDDEDRKDRERIWEHVKKLRTRVASLN